MLAEVEHNGHWIEYEWETDERGTTVTMVDYPDKTRSGNRSHLSIAAELALELNLTPKVTPILPVLPSIESKEVNLSD